MLYQVIHIETLEFKTLIPSDVLDLDYDADGRVVITDNDSQQYYLLANKDLIHEP